MRKFLLILLLSAWIIPAQAYENSRTIENMVTVDTLGASYSTIAIPTTSSVITKSTSLKEMQASSSVGVFYKATSSGTVAVTLQALRSFQKPTTEGSLDSTYVFWNVAATTSDQAWHLATLDTIVSPFLVYKITGTGSNDTSTTIQIKVEKQ